jgi:2-isopropylmalate synthase
VQDLEHDGYQIEAAEASFDLLVMKQAGTYQQTFELDHYRVNVVNQSREPVTDAVIKLRVGADAQLVVGEGDGPVNALDSALRKALSASYPSLSEMSLVDYKVDVWSTVGVSENIIEASWIALVDAFEYKIHKDRGVVTG